MRISGNGRKDAEFGTRVSAVLGVEEFAVYSCSRVRGLRELRAENQASCRRGNLVFDCLIIVPEKRGISFT